MKSLQLDVHACTFAESSPIKVMLSWISATSASYGWDFRVWGSTAPGWPVRLDSPESVWGPGCA